MMLSGDCMDKAVSNAGPLIHQAEIGEFELLKIFLTDDLDARDAGKPLGFEVHGSVGVIARAYREGLNDLERAKSALEDLYSISKLFVTKAIIEDAIKELEMF